MMNPKIEYLYYNLEDEPVSRSRYMSFLREYYGDAAPSRLQRALWYRGTGAYRLLLAIKDGRIVGQSSAYRVSAVISGVSLVLWWSVDTFVLESARGFGIGKGLQKRLHEDLENFSSVSYSRPNGIIKRKCGAGELVRVPFVYLPVDSFASLVLRIFLHRKFHKEIRVPSLFRNKYYHVNKLFDFSRKRYMAREIDLKDSLDRLSPLISESLKKFDFYVVRDKGYMQWKYLENPTIGKFHTLGFYPADSGRMAGCVIFSEPFEKQVFSVSATVSVVLDRFVFSESEITEKQMVLEAMDFLRRRNRKIDGMLYIGETAYIPTLRYPYRGRSFLSTISVGDIRNPYLGYSDQDMEQVGI